MNMNVNILPWHTALSKQTHRKEYAYGEIFPIITPTKSLLPFQIVVPTSVTSITSVKLYTEAGAEFDDITSEIVTAGLEVLTGTDYNIIKYDGTAMGTITTPQGRYYAVMTDGTTTWYSDIFTIVDDLTPYIKLEYYSYENIMFTSGEIDYTEGFKFVAYIQSSIGMPEYPFDEEAEQRDGHTFVEHQISSKKFKFNFLAHEPWLDALRLVRLNDYITITSESESYTLETFLITPKWQEGGYIADVEAEFDCDTVVKKIGAIIYPNES
jgi:hypothetical protein